MKHWAYPYIGKSWSPTGEGPEEFSCWGWVRFAFREHLGIVMPAIGTVADIKQAAEVSGWRRTEGEPQEDDIVLMRGPKGRHVGMMVRTSRGLMFSHSDGDVTDKGPIGSVLAQPLPIVLTRYCDVELWRGA